MEEMYLKDFRVPRIFRKHLKEHLRKLRRWDLSTAKRVDYFIANSTETKERIERIYARDAVVIPPPVDERFFNSNAQCPPGRAGRTGEMLNAKSYYLALGRLVPYKRFDLLIEAANVLMFPLVIAGVGREESRLKKLAGPTVRFLGRIADEELPALYRGARALLFPQHEDAGIVPLEAAASGTPVIAYERGGVRDSVIDGVTGLTFNEQTVEGIRDALERFQKYTWDCAKIREHARKFSQESFRMRIKEEVMRAYERYRKPLLARVN
jgi:glycosyltransferase involved in cell wall biosynthesis